MLRRKIRRFESNIQLSSEECCDYIFHYIESIKKSVLKIQENLSDKKQSSLDDEDRFMYEEVIEENKDNIISNLKDIEFCLKKI